VQYDKLIEQARPQIERNAPRPRRERLHRRLIFALFTHPARLRALAPVLWLQQKLGVNAPLAARLDRVPELQALLRLAPPVTRRAAIQRLPEVTPARGARRGRIALMQGCVQRVFFGDVNAATVRVLSAEGWEIHAPRQPRCCGSLQMHAGVEEEALELARQTIAAYEDFEAVAVNVAGCGSGMKDYAHLLADDPEWAERAAAFSARVKDVTELLAEHEPRAPRHPSPCASPTTTPAISRTPSRCACSRARCCGGSPELEVLEPADWEICCGSAGIYKPRQAGRRRRAGRAQGGEPAGDGRRRRRRRQPGLRDPDRLASRGAGAPDLPPDDPPGPLDPRNPPMRLDVAPAREDGLQEILRPEALDFVAELHARLGARRAELLAARRERAAALSGGGTLEFLDETRDIREGDWQVASPPRGLPGPARRDHRPHRPQARDQRAELGRARVHGRLRGRELPHLGQPGRRPRQPRRRDRGDDRVHELGGQGVRACAPDRDAAGPPARLAPPEKHVELDGERAAGSLVDFGLHVFHGGRRLAERGRGVFFYLPKLEHHLEARLWNDAFTFAEDHFGLARGTLRATVLIETLPAAFQMDEILYELREHSLGLNAGRWDYIFSMIKCFRDRPEFVLPDRNDVTMTVPFMRAYSELLVKTCHARGAFAMGGMAALIPSRKDPEANERAIAAVRADKQREAEAGFDGTWVAHPDVVPVALEEFDRVLGEKPNQIERQRPDVSVGAAELLDAGSTPGEITEAGLRSDVNVGFQYISFWLGGRGAAGIDNLMEDAATARSRARRSGSGSATARSRASACSRCSTRRWPRSAPRSATRCGRRAGRTRRGACSSRSRSGEEFPEFLTLPAYELLD
jgi:malate synthase